ncbi:MAG: hydantoinase/oxoprolinase family protein [Chloroflexi bacterium]|nr:hydantoinase/oxoprolinase family protein [Chloroflexota bacterium]
MRVGVDVGGTFTDLIAFGEDGPRIGKIPTAAPDPSIGVIQGVKDLGVTSPDAILHGSTVATNALLERKGARVGLVTTRGFGDVLEIGRQNRPRLYEIEPQKPEPLIPGELRFELTERTAADGAVLARPDPEELEQLAQRLVDLRVEAVAICFLHSYANPENERIVAAAFKGAGLPRVSISAEVLPEFREYERTSTVAANAYLAEPVERYLHTLQRDAPGPLWIVQSNGGLLTTEETAQLPVRTVLSGPAGGVTGAIWAAGASGFSDVVTFDMGGTSTDVSLCPGGPLHTNSGVVGQVPISIDMIDIHTVGAGGGSIAWVDDGGALKVGPQSAGSEPGPACYGRGGLLPTVSDANLVLGRLPAAVRLGGRMELDYARALSAIESLNEKLPGPEIEPFEIAAAVLDLANANMESALRLITIERGFDPRDFALVAFGGAGPLHACELAERLRIKSVLVPPYPGVLSALGALVADRVRSYSRTVMLPGDSAAQDRLIEVADELAELARKDLASDGDPRLEFGLDIRYEGQSFELTVPWDTDSISDSIDCFHLAHDRRYSYSLPGHPVQIVSIRLDGIVQTDEPSAGAVAQGRGDPAPSATVRSYFDSNLHATPVFGREVLGSGHVIWGPAIVTQDDCTTVVAPGWLARMDDAGTLVISQRD